ncbi:hypothetical protein [Buttiauxella agrestis]|uniref:hypothetical protein n=1 Tax=Buttiauxella agrestis TaxID=82977 RepID=UPI000E20631B|nr:hypothetical protein [Buttiauxella agrestis]
MSCSLAAITASAHAAQCDLNVSQIMTDFGTFNRGTLTVAANNQPQNIIGKKVSTVTVTCPEPTRVALFYHAPASASGKGFSLGSMAHLILVGSDAQADGHSINFAYQQEGGGASSGNGRKLPLSANRGITPADGILVTHLTFQLTAVAALNDADQHISGQEVLNNNGSLELVSE